jgi:hypothetical protein
MENPMSDKIETSGLAKLRIRETSDPDAKAMLLTDTKGKTSGYLINPEALNVILSPLLELASLWADKPSLAVDTLTGPEHALVGQHIAIAKGRHDTECAVRILVGKMELTFLMPLDEVVSAARGLAMMIDPDSGKPPH